MSALILKEEAFANEQAAAYQKIVEYVSVVPTERKEG